MSSELIVERLEYLRVVREECCRMIGESYWGDKEVEDDDVIGSIEEIEDEIMELEELLERYGNI